MILIHISYSKFMEGINFQHPRSWEIRDGEMIVGGALLFWGQNPMEAVLSPGFTRHL